jgi:hypothetical protein
MVSKKSLWSGRMVSGWVVLFLLFDAAVKVMQLAPAMEATVGLGYPERLVFVIGLVELVCVIAYVLPRTSVVGAILLTGYLGGATATQVRLEDPWFVFPVVTGVMVWAGLVLRDGRLRALIVQRA